MMGPHIIQDTRVQNVIYARMYNFKTIDKHTHFAHILLIQLACLDVLNLFAYR